MGMERERERDEEREREGSMGPGRFSTNGTIMNNRCIVAYLCASDVMCKQCTITMLKYHHLEANFMNYPPVMEHGNGGFLKWRYPKMDGGKTLQKLMI